MMSLKIIPFYAGLLGLLYVILLMRVIGTRRSVKVPFGSGGNALLERRMVVQINFTEFVPLILLLLAFLEMNLMPALVLHALGLALLASRVIHAFGVSQENENYLWRTIGTASSIFLTFVASALTVYVTAAWMLTG
ncbi:MAG: glutathione metabolism protein [Proteobacteria bacterium]|nr:MAG: glutathione metabolism protein [Pseudomonadota bacterium]